MVHLGSLKCLLYNPQSRSHEIKFPLPPSGGSKISFIIALIVLTLLIPGCEKINWENVNNHSHGKGPDARVAIDWYRLQLELLRERNSKLYGPHVAYIGIGLYESVQPGVKNSVRLSGILYQMPVMPAIEKNKEYDWQISANAAMASLISLFIRKARNNFVSDFC